MNAPRTRGIPNGLLPVSSPGPEREARNGGGSTSTMSRAELFDYEKRRIIESCFGKRDADGSYVESYITHIKVVEDATSPSSAPPPTSPDTNKKQRVIIIAVKKSGLVRMHKARENSNGSFSVGKTWNLDDLAAIESYTGATSTNAEEQEQIAWAGALGFMVTIQKPYYWQAATAKEKDFFIGSLVKIFRKYTGGRVPHLSGFTAQELAEFTAPAGQRPKPQNNVVSTAPTIRPPPAPLSARQPPSEYPGVPQHTSNWTPTRELRSQPSYETSSSRTGPQDTGSLFEGPLPTSEFVRNLKPQDSRSRFHTIRSESPAASTSRNGSSEPPSPADERSLKSLGGRSVDSFHSRREPSLETAPGSVQNIERLKTNGGYSPLARIGTPPQTAPKSPERPVPSTLRIGTSPQSQLRPEPLPERRRPPIETPKFAEKDAGTESPRGLMAPSEALVPRKSLETIDTKEPSQSVQEYFPAIVKPLKTPKDENAKEPSAQKTPIATNTALASTTAVQPSLATMTSVLSPSPTLSPPETPPMQEEIHRPGLGPMIKKRSQKEIASVFRKAALAHNAFKPRPGGAAEKIKDEITKSPNTPDGINGVFPAPSLLRDLSQDGLKSPLPLPNPATNSRDLEPSTTVPDVKITPSLATIAPLVDSTPESLAVDVATPAIPSLEKKIVAQEERWPKRPSNHSAKYAKALGIDPTLLEGRKLDIETSLSDFGWTEGDALKKSYDELQADIRRDLARVETGSWLGNFDHNDDRVAVVSKMLDRVIAECDELDGLLTLYNVELGTLSEDVAYIEAQSQGLQVQTANQRLLYSELQTLLETITISSTQLRTLRDTPLSKMQGLETVEIALTSLYKALLTIDPKLRLGHYRPGSANDRQSVHLPGNLDRIGSEISSMQAVQDKKEGYRKEGLDFIQRLRLYMSTKFKEAETEIVEAIEKNRNSILLSGNSKIDLRRRDKPRAGLWPYSPLMLFARDIDSFEWEELLRLYENTARKPYQEEFKDNMNSWKRVARKPTDDNQDALFTTQEKESDGIVARKLTVKRSKTIRDGSSRNSSGEKPQDGRINGYEAFAGTIFDMSQAIFLEQNFVVDMFHVSSLEATEFPDLVTAMPPDLRTGPNLGERKLFDPDRNMAKRVQSAMEEMYSFWPSEVQNLVDWVVDQDTLQSIGVMFALESKLAELEETNQEFLSQALSKVHSRLISRFDRFTEEQIRGIEDTKVKIKKRKGVIAFIKTFPYFASTVESMLPTPRADTYEVRHLVNDVYIKINKAMFESLKFIAKESPVVMAGQKAQGLTGGDAEDKEILNYHILLIENMNHYTEEVDVRGNPVLEEWKERAVKEMAEHMDLYLIAVIRRPLGKLLDFLESTESLLATATNGPPSIATRASHSRGTFKKLLSTFDAKEVRRGVEALRKRVEKHFGDADDPGLSRNLVQKVLRECEDRYVGIYDRTARIVAEVYEGGLEIEFKKEDVSMAFRR